MYIFSVIKFNAVHMCVNANAVITSNYTLYKF